MVCDLKFKWIWAVVVAQLAGRSLLIPEDLGSNPAIGNFYWTYLPLTVCRKDETKKEKEVTNGPFKKYIEFEYLVRYSLLTYLYKWLTCTYDATLLQGELCLQSYASGEIAMGVVGGIAVVLSVVIIMEYRNYRYEQELDSLLWKIEASEIKVCHSFRTNDFVNLQMLKSHLC